MRRLGTLPMASEINPRRRPSRRLKTVVEQKRRISSKSAPRMNEHRFIQVVGGTRCKHPPFEPRPKHPPFSIWFHVGCSKTHAKPFQLAPKVNECGALDSSKVGMLQDSVLTQEVFESEARASDIQRRRVSAHEVDCMWTVGF